MGKTWACVRTTAKNCANDSAETLLSVKVARVPVLPDVALKLYVAQFAWRREIDRLPANVAQDGRHVDVLP